MRAVAKYEFGVFLTRLADRLHRMSTVFRHAGWRMQAEVIHMGDRKQ